MASPDFEHTSNEAREIHRSRLDQLMEMGIYDLVVVNCDYEHIGGDTMGINSAFNGEPTVRIKASRSKHGQGFFYREIVVLAYDGVTLSVDGAHQIFSGQIPTDEAVRMEMIGGAIKDAFENPIRTIITDYDPRKFY